MPEEIPLTRIVEELAIAAGWKCRSIKWSNGITHHVTIPQIVGESLWRPDDCHDDAIALQDALVERYGGEFAHDFYALLYEVGMASGKVVKYLAELSCEDRLRALHAALPKCQECGGSKEAPLHSEEWPVTPKDYWVRDGVPTYHCSACNGSGVSVERGKK